MFYVSVLVALVLWVPVIRCLLNRRNHISHTSNGMLVVSDQPFPFVLMALALVPTIIAFNMDKPHFSLPFFGSNTELKTHVLTASNSTAQSFNPTKLRNATPEEELLISEGKPIKPTLITNAHVPKYMIENALAIEHAKQAPESVKASTEPSAPNPSKQPTSNIVPPKTIDPVPVQPLAQSATVGDQMQSNLQVRENAVRGVTSILTDLMKSPMPAALDSSSDCCDRPDEVQDPNDVHGKAVNELREGAEGGRVVMGILNSVFAEPAKKPLSRHSVVIDKE